MKKSDFWISRGKYQETETERVNIWLSGILCYDEGKYDIVEFSTKFLERNLDFNTIIGWYKIVIFNKEDSKWYFFGDNSNSQHFFYAKKTGDFSDSFLSLKNKMCVTPNYTAIYELLGLGFTAGENTVANEISRTDKDYYYIYDGTEITKESKNLKRLNELNYPLSIRDVIKPLTPQIKGKRIAAVCTGGTDSRAVISALDSSGIESQLVLTGHKDNPDIAPANQISKELGVTLTILNPDEKEPEWIKKGFVFTDGQYDPVLSYRHYLKAQWENTQEIQYEFGGLAGEFYKNDFCQPIRWFGKKLDSKFYYDTLLKPDLSSQTWVGVSVKKAEEDSYHQLMPVAQKTEKEHTLLEKGNSVGFDILAWKSGAITNGYSSVATKIDPLMDRQLCAFASHDNWMTHSMHQWQRKQVEKECKRIANIPTDLGYTCSMNPLLYTVDIIKKGTFYADRVFNRVRRGIGLGFKSKEERFWDNDYIDARKTDAWKSAVEYCKEKDILNQECLEADIPLTKTGWVLLFGMIFAVHN